ncbi:hypothetical protein IG631_09342 [Alternaria alternata]|nr:hypothetical protein IG631_09342 [Alternaria alternata]
MNVRPRALGRLQPSGSSAKVHSMALQDTAIASRNHCRSTCPLSCDHSPDECVIRHGWRSSSGPGCRINLHHRAS